MAYEPGTTECRVLIDSKAQIEAMLLSLSRLDNTDHICQQLKAVHNQLEGLHELRRYKRLEEQAEHRSASSGMVAA